MGDTHWAHYGSWSGVSIKGDNHYVCPKPASHRDLVVASIARPEGDSYNTINSYDGTALTWGLAQWTFTSGRLQSLFAKICVALGLAHPDVSQALAALKSCKLNFNLSSKQLTDLNGRIVDDKDQLRRMLTPPDGRVPKTGPEWELAKNVGVAFFHLGQAGSVATLQQEFMIGEIHRYEGSPRSHLDHRTPDFYLGSVDDEGDAVERAASRALYWSMFQNNPKAADDHLLRAWGTNSYSSPAALQRFAGVLARSVFGNWGTAKAKANGRTSRYEKVASVINDVLGSKLLDPHQH